MSELVPADQRLKAIRERVKESRGVFYVGAARLDHREEQTAKEDRQWLLEYADKLMEYAEHKLGCSTLNTHHCSCGLVQLLPDRRVS